MKLAQALFVISLFASLACAPAVLAQNKQDVRLRVERTIPADPSVTVLLCISAGEVIVRGGDRRDVRASAVAAERIELRRADATDANNPATRVEVLVSDQAEGRRPLVGECRASGNIQLDVPRGAVVQIQTQSGSVDIADVAIARVDSLNGDIDLRRVSKAVEAKTFGGSISLKDAKGRVRLHAASGSVEAVDVRPLEPSDYFEANSYSGDVTLERIGHAQVQVSTLNGTASMAGPLAHGGRYGFKTMSGDVNLVLPNDASFQINGKVSMQGDIITDFPLQIINVNPKPVYKYKYKPGRVIQVNPAPAPQPTTAPPPAPKAASGAPAPPAVPAVQRAQSPRSPRPPQAAPAQQTPQPAQPAQPPAEPQEPSSPFGVRRITGKVGTGDAEILVTTFSGTVRLQRKQ